MYISVSPDIHIEISQIFAILRPCGKTLERPRRPQRPNWTSPAAARSTAEARPENLTQRVHSSMCLGAAAASHMYVVTYIIIWNIIIYIYMYIYIYVSRLIWCCQSSSRDAPRILLNCTVPVEQCSKLAVSTLNCSWEIPVLDNDHPCSSMIYQQRNHSPGWERGKFDRAWKWLTSVSWEPQNRCPRRMSRGQIWKSIDTSTHVYIYI